MPGYYLSTCPHGNQPTTCPECRKVAPIVTTPRQLSWMKEHFPRHYKAAIAAITDGKAIVTQEAPGCKA
jgi:hypothetical protein